LTHQAKAVNKTPYSGASDDYLENGPARELTDVRVNKENFRSPEKHAGAALSKVVFVADRAGRWL
jgi:hypothetical protein